MCDLFGSEDEASIVALDGSAPALRPCRWCGSGQGRLTAGAWQHHKGVRCLDCERHLGWLPKPKDEPAEDGFDLIED